MSDNNQIYKILERSEKGSMYDKLICIKCNDTCLRCNFSTHKKKEKHIKKHDKNHEDNFTIRAKGSDGIFRDYETKPEKINLLNEFANKQLNDFGESKPIKIMKTHKDNKKPTKPEAKQIKKLEITQTKKPVAKQTKKPIAKQTKKPVAKQIKKPFIDKSSDETDETDDESEIEDIPYNKLTLTTRKEINDISYFIDALYKDGHYNVKNDFNTLQNYIKGDTTQYKNMCDILDHYHKIANEIKNTNNY